MRTAAGILMIITAVMGFGVIRAIIGYPGHPGLDVPYGNLLKWLSFFWAFFVGIGGIYTLKRKAWKLCLISSILQVWVIPIMPIGILPLIFICLRKREWERSESNIPKKALKIKLGGDRVNVLLNGEESELLTLDTNVGQIERVFKCLSKIDKSVNPFVEDKILIHLQCPHHFCGNKKFCREVITLMGQELTEKMQKETRIDSGGFVDFSRG